MDVLPDLDPIIVAELDALALRFRAADGVGIQVLSFLGTKADGLIDTLPAGARAQIAQATNATLHAAFDVANASRARIPDRSDRLNRLMATSLGAFGGVGGLPTLAAELPITIAVLLRAIQGIAAEHAFDVDNPETRAHCLQVFAAAGPFAKDDDLDIAFLGARMTLTGGALNSIVARVAPRLAAALGQKLAAQMVPILGAVAGAAVNYAYSNYYQEMARVYFGLRRLARDHDISVEILLTEFARRVKPVRYLR